MVFPIISNGVKELYFTDTPVDILSSYFWDSVSIKDLIQMIRDGGYVIEVHKPSVQLDFDAR